MGYSFYLIQTNTLIGPLVIAGLGIISSVWANCIFIISLHRHNGYISDTERMENNLIYNTIQYEYIVICLLTSVTLIWGLVKSYKIYLYPWACLKLCENIVILVGSVQILYKDFESFGAIYPIGLAAIGINIYVSLSVYKAYRQMQNILPFKNLINDSEELEESKDSEEHEESKEKENIKVYIEDHKPLSQESAYIPTDEKSEKV